MPDMKKSSKKQRNAERGKRRRREAISGFSTLNQVAGVSRPREHHSSLPVEEPCRIVEPHPICQYCGTPIDTIASSLSTPEGGYAHFDCVLSHIRESGIVKEGESLSYIGAGSFGIIGRNEDGKPYIVQKIQYESPERYKGMKEYVEGLKKAKV